LHLIWEIRTETATKVRQRVEKTLDYAKAAGHTARIIVSPLTKRLKTSYRFAIAVPRAVPVAHTARQLETNTASFCYGCEHF
jgi:hypothetical protein